MSITNKVTAILLKTWKQNEIFNRNFEWSYCNLKEDGCNEPNFGVRKFLDRVHVCAKFHENQIFFVVDLVWNDPCVKKACLRQAAWLKTSGSPGLEDETSGLDSREDPVPCGVELDSSLTSSALRSTTELAKLKLSEKNIVYLF